MGSASAREQLVAAHQSAQQQLQQQLMMAQHQKEQSAVVSWSDSAHLPGAGAVAPFHGGPPSSSSIVDPSPSTRPPQHQHQAQQQQQRSINSYPCARCGYPNCDVRVYGCRCLLHARCVPVPLQRCPNPRCAALASSHHPGGGAGDVGEEGGGGGGGGCTLELLPMEFAELDEARRVADLAARASWRAKEKSRARKRAKLDGGGGGGGGTGGGDASADGGEGAAANGDGGDAVSPPSGRRDLFIFVFSSFRSISPPLPTPLLLGPIRISPPKK